MKRTTKISLIVVGLIVTVGAFSSFNHFRNTENRVQWLVDEVTEELALTEPQQTKLQLLRKELMATRKATKLMLRESKEQFRALFDTPKLDQDQAVSLVASHTQFVDQHTPIVVAAFGDFYDSLNTDQQSEIRGFLQKHHNRHYE